MSVNFIYRCDCGRKYYLSIPLKMLAKEIGAIPEKIALAEKLDEETRTPEAIEIEKKTAELCGAEFKDLGINEIVQCECGKVLDMVAIWARARKRGKNESEV